MTKAAAARARLRGRAVRKYAARRSSAAAPRKEVRGACTGNSSRWFMFSFRIILLTGNVAQLRSHPLYCSQFSKESLEGQW